MSKKPSKTAKPVARKSTARRSSAGVATRQIDTERQLDVFFSTFTKGEAEQIVRDAGIVTPKGRLRPIFR